MAMRARWTMETWGAAIPQVILQEQGRPAPYSQTTPAATLQPVARTSVAPSASGADSSHSSASGADIQFHECFIPAPARFAPVQTADTKQDDQQNRAVFVSGLVAQVTWQKLKEHMGAAGTIEFATILCDDLNKSRGKACVKYSNEVEAQKAIALYNGTEYEGQAMTVDEWTGPIPQIWSMMQMMGGKGGWMHMMGGKGGWGGKGGTGGWGPGDGLSLRDAFIHGDPSEQVYITNLDKDLDWRELKDHMKAAGEVKFCTKVAKSARVRYTTAEAAQKAILELNGTELKGKAMVVGRWTDK